MIEYQAVDLHNLVKQIELCVSDRHALAKHFVSGTLNSYYQELVDYAADQLMLIPSRRVLLDLPLIDDPDVAEDAINQIATNLSSIIDKPIELVHKDLVTRMHIFPIQDVQLSTMLTKQNRLN